MNPEAVTVYTKPSCPQCDATKRWLDKNGITYSTIDVTESAEDLSYIKDELGYIGAPVVLVDDDEGGFTHWSGYRPSMLEQLVAN